LARANESGAKVDVEEDEVEELEERETEEEFEESEGEGDEVVGALVSSKEEAILIGFSEVLCAEEERDVGWALKIKGDKKQRKEEQNSKQGRGNEKRRKR
jgi:hypothetical protein